MRLTSFRAAGTLLLALSLVTACGGGGSDGPSGHSQVEVVVLSSRADMITDGSALIQATVPQGSTIDAARISVGSTDVTSQLKRTSDTTLTGVISGLQPGSNTITAMNGEASSSLAVTNWSKNGPIISGPHQEPFVCQTEQMTLPDGSTLGPAEDANCNAPTKVVFLYMPTTGSAFRVLPSTTTLPADMSTTTTSDDRTVNYIVRLETGTLNRGIYQFAVLFDPTRDVVPNPVGTFSAWNRKIIYTYGGGAGAGYIQALMGGVFGSGNGGVLNDFMLKKGYAVISSSLNVNHTNSNDVLSAETTSMVKERFIESFGVPVYAMGWGGSGGSMQQHLIANNYPGLLDGIIPSSSFADLQTLVQPVTDCNLLDRAFRTSTVGWSDAEKAAVAGFASWQNCDNGPTAPFASDWMHTFTPGWFTAERLAVEGPISNCSFTIPPSLLYDPVSNREGARCGLYDGARNLYGLDPSTGFALRVADNVGVQYGLKALAGGAISLEHFVQLNELIGGYDTDGNLQAARTSASPEALALAYGYGRVNETKNLANIPIIDLRAYTEAKPDVHDSIRSFITRERLVKANGSAANQVIIRTGPSLPQFVIDSVIDQMDAWLVNIKNDGAGYTRLMDKVVRNKPATLVDSCYSEAGQRIVEPADPDNGGQCGALYPVHSDPRLVSGAPLTNDVLKCQLRSLQRADYPGITDAQYARLAAVFSSGVCDYSKPSVGAASAQTPWARFTAPGLAEPL